MTEEELNSVYSQVPFLECVDLSVRCSAGMVSIRTVRLIVSLCRTLSKGKRNLN